jgi:hypothetical protein
LPSPIAVDHALSRSRRRFAASRSVRALRVTGFRIDTWSMPCNAPRSSCGTGAQTADQQHRHPLQVRICHRGHAVRDARPGGCEDHAHLPRQHGVTVRHVHAGAFVANVEHAHVALRELIPDRLDMPALQPRRRGRRRVPPGNSATHSATVRAAGRVIAFSLSR